MSSTAQAIEIKVCFYNLADVNMEYSLNIQEQNSGKRIKTPVTHVLGFK